MIEAAELLCRLAKTGEVRGFQFAAELKGRQRPILGLSGTYKRDPNHALAALTHAKQKLLDFMEDDPSEFGSSKK